MRLLQFLAFVTGIFHSLLVCRRVACIFNHNLSCINLIVTMIFKQSIPLVVCVLLTIIFQSTDCALEFKQTIRVASDLNSNFLEKLNDNGKYTGYKGFVKDFCDELVNILGYQYEIVLDHDQRSTGQTRVNISGHYWGGVYGMLLRNEADLAFGDTEITMERAQNFDFSSPVLHTRFAIMHKRRNKPLPVTSSHWAIFTPFPVSIWVSFSVLSILYFGFFKFYQWRSNPSARWKSAQKLKYSKKVSEVILAVWVLLLFTSYISNYTAQKVFHATVDKEQTPANVVDIVSQKDVKIGWLARGPVERFFRNTVNELYQKIYLQNIGRDWVSSVNEGVNKVLNENGKFAFILDSLAANQETRLDCNLYTLPQEFGPNRPIAVVTPIGSPLRERVNQAVLSLSEQGIIEALQSRWFSHNKNEPCSAKSVQNKLSVNGSLQEVAPIFILAVIGLFLSTLVGLMEVQLLKRRRPTAPQPKPSRQHPELLQKI